MHYFLSTSTTQSTYFSCIFSFIMIYSAIHQSQGGIFMKQYDSQALEQRVLQVATYFIAHNSTIRATAEQLGYAKSCVHYDLQRRLPKIDRTLYEQAQIILEKNSQERHIRGGEVTKRKFAALRSRKS